MRRTRCLAIVAALAMLLLTGCRYDGLDSLPLPGTQGRGSGSYQVHAEFADMAGMQPNDKVMIDNVDVGTVTQVEVKDWHALATLTLNPGVVLPKNATAKIAQVSLLGAKYIELAPPAGVAPVGKLSNGDTIPIASTGGYPETEDVLASASLLLNGGGLAEIQTITTELNKTLNGRTGEVRDLLSRIDGFAASLDQNKNDVLTAISGLDRLASQAASHDALIQNTLNAMPPALQTLNDERQSLTQALSNVAAFSDSASHILDQTRAPLMTNLDNLQPVLKSLADAGDSLVGSLKVLGSGPFPLTTWRDVWSGDYAGDVWMTLDFTNPAIARYYLPLLKGVSADTLLPGPQNQAGDPLKLPLAGPSPAPANPAPGILPSLPLPAGGNQAPAPSNSGLLGGLLGGLGAGQ